MAWNSTNVYNPDLYDGFTQWYEAQKNIPGNDPNSKLFTDPTAIYLAHQGYKTAKAQGINVNDPNAFNGVSAFKMAPQLGAAATQWAQTQGLTDIPQDKRYTDQLVNYFTTATSLSNGPWVQQTMPENIQGIKNNLDFIKSPDRDAAFNEYLEKNTPGKQWYDSLPDASKATLNSNYNFEAGRTKTDTTGAVDQYGNPLSKYAGVNNDVKYDVLKGVDPEMDKRLAQTDQLKTKMLQAGMPQNAVTEAINSYAYKGTPIDQAETTAVSNYDKMIDYQGTLNNRSSGGVLSNINNALAGSSNFATSQDFGNLVKDLKGLTAPAASVAGIVDTVQGMNIGELAGAFIPPLGATAFLADKLGVGGSFVDNLSSGFQTAAPIYAGVGAGLLTGGALAPTLGSIGGGMAGGTVGSLVGQETNNALTGQSLGNINWGQVATGAALGGIGGAIAPETVSLGGQPITAAEAIQSGATVSDLTAMGFSPAAVSSVLPEGYQLDGAGRFIEYNEMSGSWDHVDPSEISLQQTAALPQNQVNALNPDTTSTGATQPSLGGQPIAMEEAVASGANASDLSQMGFQPQEITNALATGNVAPMGNAPVEPTVAPPVTPAYQEYGPPVSPQPDLSNPVTNALTEANIPPNFPSEIAQPTPPVDVYPTAGTDYGTATTAPATPNYVYDASGTPIQQIMPDGSVQNLGTNSTGLPEVPNVTLPDYTAPNALTQPPSTQPDLSLTGGNTGLNVTDPLTGAPVDQTYDTGVNYPSTPPDTTLTGTDTGAIVPTGTLPETTGNTGGMGDSDTLPTTNGGDPVVGPGSPDLPSGGTVPGVQSYMNADGTVNWAQLLVPGAITAAAGLYGSKLQADAAQHAADVAAQAAAANTALQTKIYEETKTRMQPFVEAGTAAQTQLNNKLPSLTTPYSLDMYNASPENQVQLAAAKKQQDALKAGAAKGGGYGSGNMAMALQDNAQQNALLGYQTGFQDYWGQNNNIYNMYSNESARGQNAAAGLGTTGANFATAVGNQNTAAANAQGTASNQQGAAYAGAAGSVGNYAGNVASGYYNAENKNALANQWGTGYSNPPTVYNG